MSCQSSDLSHTMPRKKPYSAKQKKQQLKKKRQYTDKQPGKHNDLTASSNPTDSDRESVEDLAETKSFDSSQTSGNRFARQQQNHDRYKLFFQAESNEEIEKRKREARQPIIVHEKHDLEVCLEDIYKPGTVLDMPKRPQWSYKMSKWQLEENEQKMFRKYIQDIQQEHDATKLSYFEMNLETWRQLWRVLEVSNIVIIITDVRYPVIHFSPTLYSYAKLELNKDVILVLNKIDLVTPEVVVAWKYYFQEKFPQLNIICFTSFPKDPEEIRQIQTKVKKRFQRRKKKSFVPIGPRELHRVCEKIMHGKVNLKDWLIHIDGQRDGVMYEEILSSDEEQDNTTFEEVETEDGILTIGFVGHPNVGKSSLLNGLVGKKVVSCSKTPGHTKHFQTIFLTPSVRLCDSPGLVFPSLVDRRLQILSGTYPIAQVREPYSVVGYLAACIPLTEVLNLVHPKITQAENNSEDIPEHIEWSAWDICDAWAEQRGFYTAKAGRPDTYRAANSLLRLATDGKIVMCLYPPSFNSQEGMWKDHPETKEIAKLQQQFSNITQTCTARENDSSNSSNEETGNEEEIQFHNPFALLQQDD